MERDWYEVLQWFAESVAVASTIDVAGALGGKRALPYANSITQKLWKWGLIRKAKATEYERVIRGPGRPPSYWIISPKGLRRSLRKKK